MDDLYFLLEEIGYNKCDTCRLEFVDVSDIDYSIERLNMVLVTSGRDSNSLYLWRVYD